MSNLQNTKCEEELGDQFEKAWFEDLEFRTKIAGITFQRILKAFYACEGSTYNIRSLANKAFDLNLKEDK